LLLQKWPIRKRELAEQYKLRGFDSIHMASVLTLAGVLAEEGSKVKSKVGCWDKGLAEELKASPGSF
jgi:hypothetical protein